MATLRSCNKNFIINQSIIIVMCVLDTTFLLPTYLPTLLSDILVLYRIERLDYCYIVCTIPISLLSSSSSSSSSIVNSIVIRTDGRTDGPRLALLSVNYLYMRQHHHFLFLLLCVVYLWREGIGKTPPLPPPHTPKNKKKDKKHSFDFFDFFEFFFFN